VTLSAGSYAVEWHSVNSRETRKGDQITTEREEDARFTAPFAEAAPIVLYLKRVGP
jgi:hypothetical protein